MNKIYILCEEDGTPIGVYTDYAHVSDLASEVEGFYVLEIEINKELVLHRYIDALLQIDKNDNVILIQYTSGKDYRSEREVKTSIDKIYIDRELFYSCYSVIPDDIGEVFESKKGIVSYLEPKIRKLIESRLNNLLEEEG